MKESVRLLAADLWKRAFDTKTKPSFHNEGRVILDTNVVMDLLVFADASVQPILTALHEKRVVALIHPETFAELVDVLGRRQFGLTENEVIEKSLAWLAFCEPSEAPLPSHTYCKDIEDDKFFQLAMLTHCPFLVTKDKLVLKARKRAKRDGIIVLSIDDYVHKEITNGLSCDRFSS